MNDLQIGNSVSEQLTLKLNVSQTQQEKGGTFVKIETIS